MTGHNTRWGQPQRSIRIPDALWHQAQAIAAHRGDNLSDMIRATLTRYVKRHARELDEETP